MRDVPNGVCNGRSLLDAIAEWALLIDRRGVILDLNATTAALMHSSIEELRGRSIHEYSSHEAGAARQACIEEVWQTRQPCQHVEQAFGRWITTTIYPLLDGAGEVVQIALLGYDVTEWKRAGAGRKDALEDLRKMTGELQRAHDELELQVAARTAELTRANLELQAQVTQRVRAEQELSLAAGSYRSLFEDIPVGLYRSTPAGEILDANPALAQMLGYADSRALRGVAATSFYVDPANRARETTLLQRDGLVRDYTMQLRRTDGSIIWAQDDVRALRAADGKILCYEGSLVDITEKVVAEQALRRQEARATALVRAAARLNAQLGLPELLTAVCEEAVASLGISAAFVSVHDPETERPVYAAAHNMPADYARRRMPPAGNTLKQFEQEVGQVYIEDLRTAPALPNAALLVELDAYTVAVISMSFRGELIGALTVCSFGRPHPLDAVERSLLRGLADQAAQAIMNARLYASLQIRTQQAQHAARDLEQANCELSGALQLKNEVLQNLSHELRNPLTSIGGYTYLLQEGTLGRLTEEQTDAVGIIGRQAARMHSMLQRMLTLQTLTSEVLQWVEVDLAALLSQTLEAWRVRPNVQTVRMVLDTQPYLPPLPADIQLLGQVLDNLLENAVKFSPNGGTIAIRARYVPESCAIRISVSDEGIGIPTDKLERVFERYYQLKEGAGLRVGGVGVGLALCRAIVEAHGGRAWAESAGANRGSVFHVELPVVCAAARVEAN